MASRMINITSKEANVFASTTNFAVNVGDVDREMMDNVVGVSVQSISFPNLIDNVRANYNTRVVLQAGVQVGNELTAISNTTALDIPSGYYTIKELMIALNEALTNAPLWSGEFRYQQATAPFPASHSRVILRMDAVPDVNWMITVVINPGENQVFQSALLPTTLGMRLNWSLANVAQNTLDPANPLGAGDELVFVDPPLLNANSTVFLHSRQLIQAQRTIDGDGFLISSLEPVLLTSCYGEVQTQYCNQVERPTISYRSRTSIEEIKITLRHDNGQVVDLHGGDLLVTFRIWLG